MPRRKNGIEGFSSSESSPELEKTPKMPKITPEGPPVTQAWLITMFEKQSAEMNVTLDKRLEESETRIKAHLDGKITALNDQISQLQQEKEQQSDRIEALEKMLKAKNIIVSGPAISKEEVTAIIDNSLANAGEPSVQLSDVRRITAKNGTVKHIATCSSMEEKSRIMKVKKGMSHKGQKVFVDGDLTRDEQEIQFEARKFAKQHDKGTKVAVGYKRVWVNDVCYTYNRSTKSFEPPKN